jgi:hypothetical protein
VSSNGSRFHIAAVGDVILDRVDPAGAFSGVGSVLRAADITFGNCETVYSEVGELNPIVRNGTRSSPKNGAVLGSEGGFNVMAFTNNHHMDHGYEAFHRTIDLLGKQDVAVVGAGRNLAEARRPVFLEVEGTTVAFVAYCCILFPGFDADTDRPGGVPLRIHTHYRMLEEEQPGTPAAVLTLPDPQELAAMCEDIKKAREAAHIVIASFHWGLHFTRAEIADYERVVARAAIDSGADLILGHHAHILKGIDVYEGKVIFHNLGNFILDIPVPSEDNALGQRPRTRLLLERYKGRFGPQPDYPLYPFAPDARMTMIATACVEGGRITRVGFRPCLIDRENTPQLLYSGDREFHDTVDYVRAITAEAALGGRLEVDGDEVVVLG